MAGALKRDERLKLAFMFSNWYSGATLLAILLNNHKNITCNGETFPFKSGDASIYRCSCGKELLECEFYYSAAAHMLNQERKDWEKDSFVVLPKFSNNNIINKWLKSFKHIYKIRNATINWVPSYKKCVQQFVDCHLEFFVNSCAASGSSIYFDGTKSVRRAELFALYSNMPFRVVHLVRDGRGFCYSYIKNKNLSKDKLPFAAAAWLEYLDLVDAFVLRYPEVPIMTIRYEDLCRDSASVIEAVCGFLETPYDDKMLEVNSEYHILGNVMRKKFNGTVKQDLSWQQKMTPAEIDQIVVLLENRLKEYGYI